MKLDDKYYKLVDKMEALCRGAAIAEGRQVAHRQGPGAVPEGLRVPGRHPGRERCATASMAEVS